MTFPPGGLAPASGASLRLPGQHFAAAIAFLLLGATGVLWVAPHLAGGAYLSPSVVGVTHLFTLGWLTMTIFGATYQLIPVALGTPLHSERMGHLAFAAFTPGVALFAFGVIRNSLPLHHAGIGLLVVGIVLYVTNVALSLPRAPRREVPWAAMAIAVTFLSLTLVLGVVLLHNLHSGFLRDSRLPVLATHLHVALLGWVLVMIVGMSHRLLPMFLVAHGADTRWTRRSLLLLAPGVVVLATGLAAGLGVLTWAGGALAEAGVVCFLVQARSFFRARVRPALDPGLQHAAAALLFLAGAALFAPLVLHAGFGHLRLGVAYLVLGLLGGLALYVMGLFYKIVPFLAWISRFHDKMGREKVPTVAQLYSPRVARTGLGLYAAGIAGLAGGTLAGHRLAVQGGAGALLLAVGLFAAQMINARWGSPAPSPQPEPPR